MTGPQAPEVEHQSRSSPSEDASEITHRSTAMSESDRPLANVCLRCRSRKIKCGSQKPSCTNCTRSSNHCVYPYKQKPGQRAGVLSGTSRRINQLEDQCKRYEMILHNLEERFGTSIFALDHQAGTQNGVKRDDSSLDEVLGHWDSSTEVPSMEANGRTIGHLSGSPRPATKSASLPVRIDSALGHILPQHPPIHPTDAPTPLSVSLDGMSPDAFPDSGILPPPDIVRGLIDLFWKYIHPCIPILGPTHVSPKEIRESRSDPQWHPNYYDTSCRITVEPPWDIVVHAIVALTLRLSDDPRLEGKKEKYAQDVRRHVIVHATETTSISSLQALTLLSLDVLGTTHDPTRWGVVALMTRSAVQLGLSHEMGENAIDPDVKEADMVLFPPSDWHHDEARRRLFWVVYILDKYSSAVSGNEPALSTYEVNRRLPCLDTLWSRTEIDWYAAPVFQAISNQIGPRIDVNSLHPLAYLIEIVDLLGRANDLRRGPQDAYLQIFEHRRDTAQALIAVGKRWFEHLPLKDVRDPVTSLIHVTYHLTIMILSCPYAFTTHGRSSKLSGAFHLMSLESALSMATMCHEWRDDEGQLRFHSPLIIWACFLAARIILVEAVRENLNHIDHLDAILGYMRRQSQFWPAAERYVELLEIAKQDWMRSLTMSPIDALGNGQSGSTWEMSPVLDLTKMTFVSLRDDDEVEDVYGINSPFVMASHNPLAPTTPIF